MDTKHKRYIQLSWEILEHKCRYYMQQLNLKTLSDAKYDVLEDEYRLLCDELSKEPSACNMVGFDVTRPSCAMVLEKLTRRKK